MYKLTLPPDILLSVILLKQNGILSKFNVSISSIAQIA